MIAPIRFAILASLAIIYVQSSSVCHAQFNKRGQRGQIPWQNNAGTRYTVEGTLEAMRPGLLQVMIAKGAWVVGVNATTQVTVTGTADPSYLRPGQFVRFQAEFDSKGQPVAPVKEITIFTPRAPTDLGIAPTQGGIAPEPDPDAEKKKDAAAPDNKQYVIGGKLTGLKDGEIKVDAGQSVGVPLAEDVKVTLELNDLSLISKGDKISADGSYTVPGQLMGREITVTMQKPLVATPKNGRVKSKAETADAEDNAADNKPNGKRRTRNMKEKAVGAKK